ncbi:MAG: zinc/iron-chelating domain-containing protein [Gemmatales bacterium]|nr:MAG: zinc/iron-chelating domain-containing protein [Gemmatales bacterium]
MAPWYENGLRFACTRCGNCCTGAPGFVWVNNDEVKAIADFLGQPLEETEGLYTRLANGRRTLRERPNGDCIFYHREKGCTIYPVRPRQCQTWPFWESNVRTPECWQKAGEHCPGIGQGPLISAEEITRRVRVIRL